MPYPVYDICGSTTVTAMTVYYALYCMRYTITPELQSACFIEKLVIFFTRRSIYILQAILIAVFLPFKKNACTLFSFSLSGNHLKYLYPLLWDSGLSAGKPYKDIKGCVRRLNIFQWSIICNLYHLAFPENICTPWTWKSIRGYNYQDIDRCVRWLKQNPLYCILLDFPRKCLCTPWILKPTRSETKPYWKVCKVVELNIT